MGQVIGYARVSSVGQSLDVQLDKLTKAGCERVYQEKVSGTSTDGREQLAELLRYVREGDDVVITKLDRLGRSLADLLDITEQLEAKGVTLRVLDQNLETTTAQGKLMFTMLGAFAEFETALRKERQMEGIAKAKAGEVHRQAQEYRRGCNQGDPAGRRQVPSRNRYASWSQPSDCPSPINKDARGWGAALIECVYRLNLGPSKGPITWTVVKH